MAFGKRMRIANAITDLRRPPSIEYSDHQSLPSQIHHSNSPSSPSHSHSRTQSQSLSLSGTIPATTPAAAPAANTVGHVHSYSIQNSLGSPGAVYGSQQSGHLHDSPVNINDDMKAAGPVGIENGTSAGVAAGMSAAAGVGLGIALSPIYAPPEVSSFIKNIYFTYIYVLCFKKGPPSRLLLSSSNAALRESAAKTVAVNGEDEDRGHMSDVCLKFPCPIVIR